MSLREARRFQFEELSVATKDFNVINLIGVGKFGEVYKALLNDGMIVAIKKRPGAPSQGFMEEVIIAFLPLISLYEVTAKCNMFLVTIIFIPFLNGLADIIQLQSVLCFWIITFEDLAW